MADTNDSKVLEAAASVFFRYGYRRTTMADLAQAIGISRPALYLRYCNKERIFEAVVRRFTAQILEEIRQGAPSQGSPLDRLRYAFDLWVVRPYTLMVTSPDAKDLADCSFEFAQQAIDEGYAGFEAELRGILESIPNPRSVPGTTPGEIAHILASTARGFKASAHSMEELKAMIEGLLKVVLAAMG